MNSHHFMSYSRRDGVEFVTKLSLALQAGTPAFKIWIDDSHITPGQDWESEITEAIRTCETLLFIVTVDSVREQSVCRDEWSRAKRYKKPVIPLRVHANAEMPFGLDRRQYIDFTGDYESALAKLRQHLIWRLSPEGKRKTIEEQLDDATRALEYERDQHQRSRIEEEIGALEREIQRLQNVTSDPRAAEQAVTDRIAASLNRTGQPDKPTRLRATATFINPPPDRPPSYYQNRHVETRVVADFLRDDGIRLLTVSGRAGMGKTALVCRSLEQLRHGSLPDDLGQFEVDGVVYLSAVGTHDISVENLFADLTTLLPPSEAERMKGVYTDPHATMESKLRCLLESLADRRVIVLLDNFEDLIDAKTRDFLPACATIEELLRLVLQLPHHCVKVIITTRLESKELSFVEPGRQWTLPLDKGLESPYAENLLREMDATGSLGLQSAPNDLLVQVRERTQGNPRAIEAFVAILRADREATLPELLADTDALLPERVVKVLVGEAFHRLDGTAQRVMEALAVYGRPVKPAGIDFVLQPFVPGCDAAPVLNRLVNMHVVRKESGCYYLHPVDREYALSRIPNVSSAKTNVETALYTDQTLYRRGADFFHECCMPRESWNSLSDLDPHRSEIALRFAGGEWELAAHVLMEIEEPLFRWGHWRIAEDLHHGLLGHLSDPQLVEFNLGGFAGVYGNRGDMRKSAEYALKALQAARDREDKLAVGYRLQGLAAALGECGESAQAQGLLEEAIEIADAIGDLDLKIGSLILLSNCQFVLGDLRRSLISQEAVMDQIDHVSDRNLIEQAHIQQGNLLSYLGKGKFAVEHYEISLDSARQSKSRWGEIASETNLASCDLHLGDITRAIGRLDQCLKATRDSGFRSMESHVLAFLGEAHARQGAYDDAVEYSNAAIRLAKDLGYWVGRDANAILAFCHLCRDEPDEALRVASPLSENTPPRDLADRKLLIGRILLRQGKTEEAAAAFREALNQANAILENYDEVYSEHEQVGECLCGLAICGEAPRWNEAASAFRNARAICRDSGDVQWRLSHFNQLTRAAPSSLSAELERVRSAISA